MRKATIANLAYLILALIVPLFLDTLYVSVMQGRSFASSFLHWSCEGVFVACAVPFIALLRTSAALRVVTGIIALPVIFVAMQVSGAYIACVVFHSCP